MKIGGNKLGDCYGAWRYLVDRCATGRTPSSFRLGFEAPTSARVVSRAMIEALRDTPEFAPTSRQNWTSRLRGFLAFEGMPLATDVDLWRFGKPVPRKRPYLDTSRAKAIMLAARGRERLILALGLFNGFRACEIYRLKVRDLELEEPVPMVWILGKGTRGGKPRRIPLNPMALGEIRPFVERKRPEDPVYPGPYGSIDKSWRAAQRRAGFAPVGTHALRRSFGRISHSAGTPTEEIQKMYGHSSPVTTVEYIDVEDSRMAKGLARMAAFFAEAT